MTLSRREFVSSSMLGLAGLTLANTERTANAADAAKSYPIIDCHTHFYDPRRPEGIPWPSKEDKLLYRPVLPNEFENLTEPFGVTGTLIVEASSWVEDNQWLLDLAAENPFIVGIIGNLTPGMDTFAQHLSRFAKNPHYRGIRIGVDAIQKGIDRPEFLADLKRMIDSDLTLDVNGGPEGPAIIGQLATKLPELRIVINHLGNVRIDGKEPPRDWTDGIRAAAKSPHVFMKVSGYIENGRVDGMKLAPEETAHYRPVFDRSWDAFGVDRMIYGSDWPVSDVGGHYGTIIKIATEYFRDKGDVATKKFFADNAQKAYRWPNRG